jgi:hypothetical protein
MPEEDTKIVEALKRLRIIEKRVEARCKEITRYASGLSGPTYKPLFDTEERQRQEVKSLVQSALDLLKEYHALKRRIEVTNLLTIVTIEGESRSIAEWLIEKRKVSGMILAIYNALNEVAANASRREDRMYPSGGGATPQVTRFYSEEEKNKELRHVMDRTEAIDGRLEVINATTELVDDAEFILLDVGFGDAGGYDVVGTYPTKEKLHAAAKTCKGQAVAFWGVRVI